MKGKVDSITLEVIRNGLVSLSEEMGVAMERSAYTELFTDGWIIPAQGLMESSESGMIPFLQGFGRLNIIVAEEKQSDVRFGSDDISQQYRVSTTHLDPLGLYS